MSARLTMICCGATAATREAAFAADDAPLEADSLARARALAPGLRRADRVWTGPELRTRQTAEALGLDASPSADLRDRDFGAWVGMRLADLHRTGPAGLETALSDPQAAPHGGESLAKFCARISALMQNLLAEKGSIVVVTHPVVIRAAVLHALSAPVEGFWRVDVESLAQIRFTSDGRRWALRIKGPGKDGPGK